MHQSPGTGQFISYQHSPFIQSPVVGLQSSYPASISSHHSRSSEQRLPSNDNMGSEHSFAHELPNPATFSRMILPVEPNYSQMSDPSIIIEPPNTWRSNDKHSSQTRPSRKEQSKRRHRSKKKRHRLSSSSSSSKSTSSHKNKKSKRSKHSHKKRRRRSTSPSSSLSSPQSENDYDRYKRVKLAPQVANSAATPRTCYHNTKFTRNTHKYNTSIDGKCVTRDQTLGL